MSKKSRIAPRRSVLAVPGSSERFLEKAAQLAADMVLLDLEDSVVKKEKNEARLKVAHAVRSFDWGEKIVGVRVNAFDTPYTVRDLVEVLGGAGARLDVVVLAKSRNAHEIAALDLILSQLEAEAELPEGHVGIEALIENAEGISNVKEIASSSPRLEALAFGPGDLAASLGMSMGVVGDRVAGYPGHHYHSICMELLVAGRRSGLQVIDGPYLGLDDLSKLKELAELTRALGFDGKWAIHPSQIEVLNEVYSPTEEELGRARSMLAALRAADVDEARGAIRYHGEMLDEVNRKMAMATLARASRSDVGGP